MFQLDDQFLKELGLDQLPENEKQAFLEHIYNELEMRVGIRLSEGLSDEQMSEFEAFVDRNEEKVRAWVMRYAPDYTNDPAYQQLRENKPEGLDDMGLLAEYASLKWLSMNRPNYREVVNQVMEELKAEIRSNRDTILGSGPQTV